jgi:hypothetical protein
MAVLFIAKVYQNWEDQRDSSNRVHPLDHPSAQGIYREIVLNPYFMTDILSHALGSTLKYSDNFGDRREKWSRIVINKNVTQLQAYFDTTPHTNAITLPIHKNNNPEKETVDTTIQWSTISYVTRYNPDPEHHCWIVYDKGSFKRVEVLANLAMEDVPDLVRTGTTTTTFSTIETSLEDESAGTYKFTF